MSKRYLITYKEQKINTKTASNLLEMSEQDFDAGIGMLAEGRMQEDTPVHLDKLSISVVSLEESEVKKLSAKDEILAIEEDVEVRILGFESENEEEENQRVLAHLKEGELAEQVLWNIEHVKAPDAWAEGIDGSGINLAILDTGIAAHPDLVITGGTSFVSDVTNPSYDDQNGHGTHCAGIAAGRRGLNGVYGVAKNCNLFAVKVLNQHGSGSFSSIFAGMNWCIENEIHVASMSLGANSVPSVAAANAVKNCQDNGVTVVVAAGNSYQSAFPWVGTPANSYMQGDVAASPIAVAAVDRNNQVAPFSSRGAQHNDPRWNQVNVSAPGVNIYSTYLNNGYKVLSGTSMACPHVAGMAALIYQKHSGHVSPHTVKQKILNTAHNLGPAPYPNEAYGFGLIDCSGL